MIRSALYITHEYGVDSNGTRTLRYRYTYDEANQITRVDDNIQSKTYVYQYDKGGNRVSEKIYAYTLFDSLGSVKQEIVSEYENLVWDDLLTSYNGKDITYDNAGNPLTYDGQTYVWDGKQLKEVVAQDGSKTVFNYDANGLRTRKLQYNAEGDIDYLVEYVWSDGKIVSQYLTLMLRGTIMNEYQEIALGPIPSKVIYDDNGIPQGFTCGSACFGFVRNLQGDAIALVDYDGNIVMEYSYDPWGNIEYHLADNVTEEEAIIYTALCPLTYRGYNYDFTTGLYYLQSRYYNPEWGRFLNCDDTAILLATQGEDHGANLFAYCDNNPINCIDKTGYWAKDVHKGIIGTFDIKKDYYKLEKNEYKKKVPYNIVNGEKVFYGTYYWALSIGFNSDIAEQIGEYSNKVDSKYNPVAFQSWHFNTSRKGETDSRIILMTFMLLASISRFDDAVTLIRNGYSKRSIKYKGALSDGIEYLGYALHPAQDYYAHTDDRVYDQPIDINSFTASPSPTYKPVFIYVKSHLRENDDTDNPIARWKQLLKTEAITNEILRMIYDNYPILFK